MVLQEQLQLERLKSLKFHQDLQDLTQKLETSTEFKTSESSQSEVWLQERAKFISEIQCKIIKVVKLRSELDDARRSFKNMQSLLIENDCELKRRNEIHMKTQEYLYKMCEDMLAQDSLQKLDKQTNDRKISRIQQRAEHLEEQNKGLRDKLYQAQLKLSQISNDDSKISRIPSLNSRTAHIRRTIKGGAGKSQVPESKHVRCYSNIDVSKIKD